jgi:hypothetical protein
MDVDVVDVNAALEHLHEDKCLYRLVAGFVIGLCILVKNPSVC